MKRKGLTLIEMLLVFSLVAILATGAFISFSGTRANQAIWASANNLKIILERARIYSREGRNEKAWGVGKSSENKYYLMEGSPSSFVVIQEFYLEEPTRFNDENWLVWFLPGSGNVLQETDIKLINNKGDLITTLVTLSGQIVIQK